MAIDQTITTPPTAPSSNDAITFRTRADAFVAWIVTFVSELTALIAQINIAVEDVNSASTATINASNFQGAWSSATAYTIGQSVLYSGTTYMALLAGTNKQPNIEPAYWESIGMLQMTHSAPSKTTPIDADELPLFDSASAFGLKKLTWANLKTLLFGSPSITGTPTAPTAAAGTNTTQLATTAFVKEKSEADSIGVGQTWQDVTGSRVSGTTYTNSTGKPIVINPIMTNSGSNTGYFSVTIGGLVVGYSSTFGGGNFSSFPVVVPNGSTYSVAILGTGSSYSKWTELR